MKEMIFLEDKFTSGFLAGVTGGLVANGVSFIFGFLGLTALRFADWTGIIIFGHIKPFSTGEILFALATNIGFTGVLGIVFTYLIFLIKSTNFFLKGWVFSTSMWFIIYTVTALFKVEGTTPLPLSTVIANAVTASTYGLVLVQALRNIVAKNIATEKESIKFRMMAPAMKPIEKGNDDTE